eukprot:scaffold81346_cov41-Prasinocladus_malaysianus.AAC.2
MEEAPRMFTHLSAQLKGEGDKAVPAAPKRHGGAVIFVGSEFLKSPQCTNYLITFRYIFVRACSVTSYNSQADCTVKRTVTVNRIGTVIWA